MQNRSTFSLLFWANTSRIQNDEVPVYVRITVNGKRVNISLQRKIPVSDWDSNQGKAKGTKEGANKSIPCRNTVFGFNHLGYKTIQEYGNNSFYFFDDLGVEPSGRHYGKDCNVMREILLSRYDIYHKKKMITNATKNLNAKELEERYGNRVRSRMHQLFNLIAFDKESVDKRK